MAEKVTESIRKAARDQSSSVVRIRCNDDHGEIVGTGFTIDPTGTIITLAEIVRGAEEITVEQPENGKPGKIQSATVVAIDQRSGIAFLKAATVEGSTGFITPSGVTNVTEMTPVISIGYPGEEQATPTLGIITGSKNHEGETFFCVTHLTASMPLTAGEGGAPILDLDGHLIGIVISGNTQLGTCTILPSGAIEQLHNNLLRYGGINHGWVGAVVEIAAVPQNNSRTRVVSVATGSPAERAGIRAGDTLLALGNHAIHTPDDVLDASFYLNAGEPLQVTISREGVTKNLTLVCGEPPEASGTLEAMTPATPASLLGEMAH